MCAARIRPAQDRDVDAVAALAEQWVEEDITYGQAAPPASWFRGRLDQYFFVAIDGSHVVGYAQGESRTSDPAVAAVLPVGTPFVEVINVYVTPAYRRQGVGGQLLDAVLGAAQRDGIDRSLLFTGTKDVFAVLRFYGRHGYHAWGVQMIR